MRVQRLSAWSLEILLLSVAACLSAPTLAEAVAYKVEMLIFVHESGAMTAGSEPAEPLSNIEAAIDLGSGESENFHALPANELALATAESILERAGRYDVIQNIAWVQPGLAGNAAKAVHIHGGVEYQWPLAAPAQLGRVSANSNLYPHARGLKKLQQLDGTIEVALDRRYFHVYRHLVLRKPITIRTVHANQQPQRTRVLYQFRIKDEARMRIGELYYLDHPLLGILAQITPVDKEPGNTGLRINGQTPRDADQELAGVE
jgi:hypothetical protein